MASSSGKPSTWPYTVIRCRDAEGRLFWIELEPGTDIQVGIKQAQARGSVDTIVLEARCLARYANPSQDNELPGSAFAGASLGSSD